MQFWQVAIPRNKPDQLDYLQIYKKWVENPGKRDEMLPEVKPETASARPYKQTHATLDREIACALLPVAPEKITPSILKAADEIISQDREDFKRWSMALRTTDQILAYDRASVFGVIQSAPAKTRTTSHNPCAVTSTTGCKLTGSVMQMLLKRSQRKQHPRMM